MRRQGLNKMFFFFASFSSSFRCCNPLKPNGIHLHPRFSREWEPIDQTWQRIILRCKHFHSTQVFIEYIVRVSVYFLISDGIIPSRQMMARTRHIQNATKKYISFEFPTSEYVPDFSRSIIMSGAEERKENKPSTPSRWKTEEKNIIGLVGDDFMFFCFCKSFNGNITFRLVCQQCSHIIVTEARISDAKDCYKL